MIAAVRPAEFEETAEGARCVGVVVANGEAFAFASLLAFAGLEVLEALRRAAGLVRASARTMSTRRPASIAVDVVVFFWMEMSAPASPSRPWRSTGTASARAEGLYPDSLSQAAGAADRALIQHRQRVLRALLPSQVIVVRSGAGLEPQTP